MPVIHNIVASITRTAKLECSVVSRYPVNEMSMLINKIVLNGR